MTPCHYQYGLTAELKNTAGLHTARPLQSSRCGCWARARARTNAHLMDVAEGTHESALKLHFSRTPTNHPGVHVTTSLPQNARADHSEVDNLHRLSPRLKTSQRNAQVVNSRSLQSNQDHSRKVAASSSTQRIFFMRKYPCLHMLITESVFPRA